MNWLLQCFVVSQSYFELYKGKTGQRNFEKFPEVSGLFSRKTCTLVESVGFREGDAFIAACRQANVACCIGTQRLHGSRRAPRTRAGLVYPRPAVNVCTLENLRDLSGKSQREYIKRASMSSSRQNNLRSQIERIILNSN